MKEKQTSLIMYISITTILALLFCAVPGIEAATLSLNETQSRPGSEVRVEIKLKSEGAQISAMNFDIEYDSSKLSVQDAVAGTAMSNANVDKTLGYNNVSDGLTRIVIYGLNQNAIGDARVAEVVFKIKEGASEGDVVLKLKNAVAASPAAEQVSLTLTDGKLTIDSGIPAPPKNLRLTSSP